MAVTIKLTQGQFATVCNCHAHLVDNHKWFAQWYDNTKSFRALRQATVLERLSGSLSKIYMHTVINGTPKGFLTDHIDHNTLNNQCSNLRTATASENQCNRARHIDGRSGFKGVSWRKSRNRWHARITVNGKDISLGFFMSAEEAALRYDDAARKYHGEFAQTNFGKGGIAP